ncbi:TetR family transcriptional regulator [Nocardia sp. SYP-A9097]|uniref:TetR/AcrR family transcriptional regulator n=1 Tax=Nocardia sp. SYP-A9097 TaxID=2663237 RepID=UPI00129AC9BA|nr:TetR/AcrR family transcriptional regulator [Nocardia sp. SYP-A9097]MRH89263.1 TetR family transcriptional regulator [Nocardia sp. SYP-A9097]
MARSSASAPTQKRGTSESSGRRAAICAAALELAAEGGNRAVTHHAIDDRVGIARGSTSYYYRTRQDLLRAAVIHLATTSRQAFLAAQQSQGPSAPSVDSAADLMAGQLDLLLGPRRRDALARYALAADTAADQTLREALAGCLFSLPAATALMKALGAPDAEQAAHNAISLLEGLLFDRLHGTRSLLGLQAGTPDSLADLRPPVHRWLTLLRKAIR